MMPKPSRPKPRPSSRRTAIAATGRTAPSRAAINYVADLAKLVARKKVIPGDPTASRLFKRLDEGTMPPPDEKPAAQRRGDRRW